ncbi:MAG: hypothetical protein ACJAT2_001844 [Bacteriovoracaceae bacterium]|jgi:hypothetical protein
MPRGYLKSAKVKPVFYDSPMKLLIALIVTLYISPAYANGLVSPITEEMHKVFSKKDHKTLRERGFVIKKKNVNKSAWPELTFYFETDASPLEAISVFAAFEHQVNYVPGIIKSKVIKQESPILVHTEYEMDMPWPIPNSKYVHASTLKQIDAETYRMEWYMVKSNSADIVKGFAEFYPRDGKTIFKYRSFINPKSFLAGLFKKTMIKDVQTSLEAIRLEIEKLKGTQKGREFVGLITTALSGKFAYPNGQSAQ